MHRALTRMRNNARRGSSVDFKEEADIIGNGLSGLKKARIPERNAPTCEVREGAVFDNLRFDVRDHLPVNVL